MVEKFTVERQTGQVKTIESDLTFLKSSKEINEHKKALLAIHKLYFHGISLKARTIRTDRKNQIKYFYEHNKKILVVFIATAGKSFQRKHFQKSNKVKLQTVQIAQKKYFHSE